MQLGCSVGGVGKTDGAPVLLKNNLHRPNDTGFRVPVLVVPCCCCCRIIVEERSFLFEVGPRFYFCSYTMTSVGYGDLGPKNMLERTVCTMMILTAGLCWAYVLGGALETNGLRQNHT